MPSYPAEALHKHDLRVREANGAAGFQLPGRAFPGAKNWFLLPFA
jgi:hypothetical protein